MTSRKQRIEKIEKNRNTDIAVVLYEIEKKDNVSLILRSIEAFGFKKVYIVPHPITKSKINPSVAKYADKWLDIEYVTTEKLMGKLKKGGYKLLASVLDPDAKKLSKIKLPKKLALLIGTETKGLPENIIQMSDFKAYIPMKGLTQSLNVSAAASIFLYKLSQK